jgi:MFS transporter, FHS family, L-fucose permease
MRISKPHQQAVYADQLSRKQVIVSIIIIAGMFFIFGFVSWMNAILIPYFKIACELTNFESYLVAFAFYISYFVMSLPAGYLLKNVGYRKGMMVGFFIMATGAFIFIPAALERNYNIFLLGLFSLGAGLAILQTAANPYVTILGPVERAAQRFSIMGIFNKGAGILAPILFAHVILKATDSDLFAQLPSMSESTKDAALDELVQRVIVPYACLGTMLFIIGLLIRISPLPEVEPQADESGELNIGKRQSILQFPHLVLGAIAIFLHVGTQVISIDTIISYADSMGIPLLEAKIFPSLTLGATLTGYLLGLLLIPRFIRQVNALRVCTLLGLLFSLCIYFANGNITLFGLNTDVSIWFVVLLGLANSLIWAGIWPLALEGLGRFTKIGASLMIMALCGNALLPLIYGRLADDFGLRAAYLVLVPCFAYLVFYAFYGHRLRRWSIQKPAASIPLKSVNEPA